MDVKGFAEALLRALTDTGLFERVALQTEGPVAHGMAYVREGLFLRFYCNQISGTMAFALIAGQERVWGIDYDNRRGWHLHPKENPSSHVRIDALTVQEVVTRLQTVLLNL
jgi:hypothetical protein